MSKPRYIWWSYAKEMIRQYPELKKEYEALHQQNITASMTGIPGGGGASRTTEHVALRLLSPTKQKEFDAVGDAIQFTQNMKNGKDRLKVISLVLWQNGDTIEGAAQKIHCSKETAWRYHRDFIRLVGKCYGFDLER